MSGLHITSYRRRQYAESGPHHAGRCIRYRGPPAGSNASKGDRPSSTRDHQTRQGRRPVDGRIRSQRGRTRCCPGRANIAPQKEMSTSTYGGAWGGLSGFRLGVPHGPSRPAMVRSAAGGLGKDQDGFCGGDADPPAGRASKTAALFGSKYCRARETISCAWMPV